MVNREAVLRLLGAAAAGLGILCAVGVGCMNVWFGNLTSLSAADLCDLALGCVWPILGAIVVRSQPRNMVGWLMILPALIDIYQLLRHYAAVSAVADQPLPAEALAAWVGTWGFAPAYFIAIPLLPLVFPDGRLPSGPWRYAAYAFLAVAALLIVFFMFVESDLPLLVQNPLGMYRVEGWMAAVPYGLAAVSLVGGPTLGVVYLLRQTRRTIGVERAQVLWLLLGALVTGLSFGTSELIGSQQVLASTSDVLFAFGVASVPLAITIAMLRHHLFDVAFVLNRTIVYAALTSMVLVVYLVLVLAAGWVATRSTFDMLLVASVALLAAFARDAVQRGVDRLIFGLRRDAYLVPARVGQHVASAAEPADALQRLVDALRTALRLPYVAYVGALTIVTGTPVAGWHAVPARTLGQTVGELRLGRRRSEERLTADEHAAAEDVALRAGTLAYAAGLVSDIAESRAKIVAAREEERRRLTADLHDGIGPALAGTAHQLDALARRLDTFPDQGQLAERARAARDRLRRTVGEVRDLVHGLRPAVLDQIGFVDALRDLVAGYDAPHCLAEVSELGPLPAAVEVAGYAVAAEAITNAVRHSGASEIRLSAAIDGDELVVEVRDNGRGIPSDPRAGVGLASMAERTAEVGGHLDIQSLPTGGTIVRATLPVTAR